MLCARQSLADFDPVTIEGEVLAVDPAGVVVADALGALSVGARVTIEASNGARLLGEATALAPGEARVALFGDAALVRRGARARFSTTPASVAISSAWLGRVVDALGHPIDGAGPLAQNGERRLLHAGAPPPIFRERLGDAIDVGVSAIDAFAPLRRGQRLGLFANAGVGKSALLGMAARHIAAETCVIALIGERARETREFLEDHLGPEGLSRSIIVIATADEPAAMRRQAAFLAITAAEALSAEGRDTLFLFDSLTRLAQAQREIGLAAGEAPTTKGYPPSAHALIAQIAERAGPRLPGEGAITALFSVLAEGDLSSDPIAETTRAALDGHIILSRAIAERGRFPAIDAPASLSRGSDSALEDDARRASAEARALMAVHDDMADMIRLGAYREGGDPQLDRAIALRPSLEALLAQPVDERRSRAQTFARLRAIVDQQSEETR